LTIDTSPYPNLGGDVARQVAVPQRPIRFRPPKFPPKSRNAENPVKSSCIVDNWSFSATFGLRKTPCTQVNCAPRRKFLCLGTRVRNAVNSNSLGTFVFGGNFKILSENSKAREATTELPLGSATAPPRGASCRALHVRGYGSARRTHDRRSGDSLHCASLPSAGSVD
jgi:hypothetical protein